MLGWADRWFDRLEASWEGEAAQRAIGTLLVASFVGTLVAVEVGRRGGLPAALAASVPASHFFAVDVAFTLLLLVEAVGLVFSLAQSVTRSVGKQLEILSLILLRRPFKQLTYFEEPIDWAQASEAMVAMLADAAGALLIFVVLVGFYRAQRHQPITDQAHELGSFIASKKLIALLLLAAFVAVGLSQLVFYVRGTPTESFFDIFYTVLIFTDILLVLVSYRYGSAYSIVLRNSGFAVATLLIRIALTAPPVFNAALGLTAALFALSLTVAYNAFTALPGAVHKGGAKDRNP